MEELLDYDGPWSPDLVNLMTPMAELADLEERERMIDAVATIMSKDGLKGFQKRAKQLRESVRTRQLAARGASESKSAAAERDFRTLEAGFGILTKPKPKGRGKR